MKAAEDTSSFLHPHLPFLFKCLKNLTEKILLVNQRCLIPSLPSVPLCSPTPPLSRGHGKNREFGGEQLSPLILSTALAFPDHSLCVGRTRAVRGCSQDGHSVQGAPSGVTPVLTQKNELGFQPLQSPAPEQSLTCPSNESKLLITGWTGLSIDPRLLHSGILHNGNFLFEGGEKNLSRLKDASSQPSIPVQCFKSN